MAVWLARPETLVLYGFLLQHVDGLDCVAISEISVPSSLSQCKHSLWFVAAGILKGM